MERVKQKRAAFSEVNTIYMGRETPVLGQDPVRLTTERSSLNCIICISMDVVGRKIRANSISNFPVFDVLSDSYDFPSHIRAGNKVRRIAVEILE